MSKIITSESIFQKIFLVREQKVMLDMDLAQLYGVSTGRLNEQVKRNIQRFPDDFMFQLTPQEAEFLISQFAISRWGGRRKLPYAFTEQGVAMLSSVLKSERAIQVNIAIMRTFAKLKGILSTHKELAVQIKNLEHKVGQHDKEIKVIFEAIRQLITVPEKPKRKIGFHDEK